MSRMRNNTNKYTYMLNILYKNVLKKKQDSIKIPNEHFIKDIKHNIPSYKEWNNSIYNFNKSSIKHLTLLDNQMLRIIKNYLNFFFTKIEKNTKLPYVRKWKRRLSLIRILVSKAELKHTSDTIIINLYIFNRQKVYYTNKLMKLKKKMLMYFNYLKYENKTNFLNTEVKLDNNINSNKLYLLNGYTGIESITTKKIFDMIKYKLIISKNEKLLKRIKVDSSILDNVNNTILNNYTKKLRLIMINRFFTLEKLYFLFKQNLFLNHYKFKSTYMLPITKLLEILYNKKIYFNIITLKYPYLDSSIYLQLIKIKLRKRKNRIANVLSKSMAKIRVIRPIRLITLAEIYSDKLGIYNLPVFKLLNTKNVNNIDKLEMFIDQYSNFYKETSHSFVSDILKLIKYKTFIGLRVEASGRLTKRITASRSLFKLNNIGGIKNIYPSLKGMSASVSRGNLNSSLDVNKVSSKTRIGSYGLKGWVNSI